MSVGFAQVRILEPLSVGFAQVRVLKPMSVGFAQVRKYFTTEACAH